MARRSSEAFTSGRVIALADVPVRIETADRDQSDVVLELLGVAPAESRAPLIDVRWGHERLAPPDQPPGLPVHPAPSPPDRGVPLRPGDPAARRGACPRCVDYADARVRGLAGTDVDGTPREVNEVCTLDPSCGFGPPVDRGAFEYQAPLCVETPIHNVTRDVYYECIQTAIDDAADTHEIIVAPGTYVENINFHGKAITLRSSHGPDVTTIDGQQTGTVVSCLCGEGPDTVLGGLTLTGARGGAGGTWVGPRWPAARARDDSPSPA